ncbi:MAG: DUF512 domain-containing protein [Anaerolineae bacterium]|jgi:putative radical SAM enzyme (TIGR03279 family)
MSQGGLVSDVSAGSLADEIGLEPGDRILSANGQPLRDVIDFQFYAGDELVVLEVLRDGIVHRLEIERDLDESWGISFAEPTFDGMRQCTNHCPFCFVQQMPPGLRPSLYIKDDDYRYSFLYGNYVTLTNLDESDWDRLAEQRLSPLYVSIHAADPSVRRRMLGNRRAPDVRQQIKRLGEIGIQVHAQVVVCPGMNDGDILAETVRETASLHPIVQSLAIVPVGLTRFHRSSIRPLTAANARAVLDLADQFWAHPPADIEDTWLYPSDEILLLAQRPIPPAAFYQEEAQYENGIGMVRSLLDDWAALARKGPPPGTHCHEMLWVCGTLIAPVLSEFARSFASLTGCRVQVLPVVNRSLGDTVTVSGLLFGSDVLAALEQTVTADLVVLPRGMFEQTGTRTLDDMTLEQLSGTLGRPILIADTLSDLVTQIQR